MRAHARRLDDAPQRFLAPTPARLVRLQHHAGTAAFPAASDWLDCASVSSCFFTSPSVAACARLALLQAFLVSFELLLERFDQRFDGFLPLRQIAFGRFLKFAERLLGQPQKFRRALFQRLGAQRLERLAQIGQRLFLQRALFRDQFFRRRPAGFRRGTGVAGFGELAAQLGQFRFALGDLLAQFIFQPRIRTAATRRGRRASRGENPARRQSAARSRVGFREAY